MEIVAIGRNNKTASEALNTLSTETWEAFSRAKCIVVIPRMGHHLDQAAITPINDVRCLIEAIRERTSAPIVIASASSTSTRTAFRLFGYDTLPADYAGVSLVDVNEDETCPVYEGQSAQISKLLAEAEHIVSFSEEHDALHGMLHAWIPEPVWGASGKIWPRWNAVHISEALLGRVRPQLVIQELAR